MTEHVSPLNKTDYALGALLCMALGFILGICAEAFFAPQTHCKCCTCKPVCRCDSK